MSPRREWRCDAHEDLVREVAEVRTIAEQTLDVVKRIEARQYEEHGQVAGHGGQLLAVARSIGWFLMGLAAVGTLAVAVWHWIGG